MANMHRRCVLVAVGDGLYRISVPLRPEMLAALQAGPRAGRAAAPGTVLVLATGSSFGPPNLANGIVNNHDIAPLTSTRYYWYWAVVNAGSTSVHGTKAQLIGPGAGFRRTWNVVYPGLSLELYWTQGNPVGRVGIYTLKVQVLQGGGKSQMSFCAGC